MAAASSDLQSAATTMASLLVLIALSLSLTDLDGYFAGIASVVTQAKRT